LPPHMARPLCHFHSSPGGCRKGNKCYFAHTINIDSTTLRDSSRSSFSQPGLGSTSESSRTPIPPGICRYYWTRGECQRGSECRYKHVHSRKASSSTNLIRRVAPKKQEAVFLTEYMMGLAKIEFDSNATDRFFCGNQTSSLPPIDVHSRLNRFLADNFKFSSRFNIYSFLVLLCSASSSNTLWVHCRLAFLNGHFCWHLYRLRKKDWYASILCVDVLRLCHDHDCSSISLKQ
jgi:hypothetical protein